MVKYELTHKAVDDLSQIYNYTAEQWSEAQADKYFTLLIEGCQKIANNPELGKNYMGVVQDLFGLSIGKHIIFYRKLQDRPVEITRILHEKMDWRSRLKNELL